MNIKKIITEAWVYKAQTKVKRWHLILGWYSQWHSWEDCGKRSDDPGWGWGTAECRLSHSADQIIIFPDTGRWTRMTVGVMSRGQINCHISIWDSCPLHKRQSQTVSFLSVYWFLDLLWRAAACVSYCLYFTCYHGSLVMLWLWCQIRYAFQNWKFLRLCTARSHSHTLIFNQTNDSSSVVLPALCSCYLVITVSHWLIMGGKNRFEKLG